MSAKLSVDDELYLEREGETLLSEDLVKPKAKGESDVSPAVVLEVGGISAQTVERLPGFDD